MMLPGKLTVGFLQEDNPQKYYFRVRPLVMQEGDSFTLAENVKTDYAEDGYIRIVPDKNELSHFKTRMRQMGCYCLMDLRRHPNENDKIRPNKNHAAENGDRNAYIVYSDVIFSVKDCSLAEVVEAEGEPEQIVIARPGTAFVALMQNEVVKGLYRWTMQEDQARLSLEKAVPVNRAAAEISDRLFTVETAEGEERRILVDLKAFGAQEAESEPAEQRPASMEASEELQPAARMEKTERPEKQEKPREKREEREEHKESAPEAKPWLQQTTIVLPRSATPHSVRDQVLEEQSGFNPRRGPSIKEILDDMWRQSRVDQLGHPVPGDAQSVPAANPVEEAARAAREAWDIPEARASLIEALLKLEQMPESLGVTGEPGLNERRAIRRSEEKLSMLEAERLKLVCELDELKKQRNETRAALLEQLKESHKRELESTQNEITRLNEQKAKADQSAQRAHAAAELAGQSVEHVLADQMDTRMADQLANNRAQDLLLAMAYGREAMPGPVRTEQPTAGELISELRVRFETAGIALSNDDAVNLLICVAQSHLLMFSGRCGSGKSLYARTLGAALGLRGCGRYFEVQPQPDWKRLGDQIASVSPTGVPLIRMPALRNLLRIHDGQTPTMLVLDDANRAPIERYAGELLSLGEAGAPNVMYTASEALALSDQLRVVMTIHEGANAAALTENLLDRGWLIRLDAPSAQEPWQKKRAVLPETDLAVSLKTLRTLFAPSGDLPGEMTERMETLRARLAEKGVNLSRRALDDTYDYCAAAVCLMKCEPMQILDRALSQRVMPALLAGASLEALREVGTIFADMPRCLALLNTPVPLPEF